MRSGVAVSAAIAFAVARAGVWAQGATEVEKPTTICEALSGERTTSLPVWRPPGDTAHGIHEFDGSARLDVPNSPTITLELWGGGGGGGGGSDETYTEGGAGGGGGAGGAYSRTAIAARPDHRYTLIVGRGGRGGAGGQPSLPAGAGQDGGDSFMCDDERLLLLSPGGNGGGAALTNNRGGQGGRGRDATGSNAAAAIHRAGHDGANGDRPLFEYRGWGGRGGRVQVGTVESAVGVGGAGGAGAMRPDRAGDGMPGGPGHAIVTW
jgi:hypothetical protein